MNPLAKFHAYWFAPAPSERLAALRVTTGAFALVYLLSRSVHLLGYADFPPRDFRPVGILSWLETPLPTAGLHAIYGLSVLAGIGFVSGICYRIAAPAFALGFLLITTYRCSWGMVFHQDNLVALHLAVLAAAPAAAAWSYDARQGGPPRAPSPAFGWPIRAMCWLTVVSYVLAGIAKLKNIGWEWGSGDVLRTHVAYDALRKLELGGLHSPLGAYLVQFEWVFPALGVTTLMFELGAPLALLGGKPRTVWVAGIWGFHLGVIALMAITFAYPVSGCAFASFFAVERLQNTRLVQKVLSRTRRAAPS